MALITFNYNKHLIYAIIYWAIEIISRSFIYFKWEYFRIIKDNDAINEYIYLILINISDLLAGFLVTYIQYSLKKNKSYDYSDTNTISTIVRVNTINYTSIKENFLRKTKKFYIKMALICSLDYIDRLASFIFYQTNKGAKHENIYHKAQTDIITHLDILFRYIFSIFFLKTKIFKHHKFSIAIICIAFIILIPTDIISIHYFPIENHIDINLTYIYIAVFSIRGIFFPLEDTIVKKVFIEDYILPEHFMFFRGIGDFIIIILVTPILYFSLYAENVFSFGDVTKIIITIILYTLSSFIKAYLLIKVIYYFSSQSVSFLIISESVTGSICEIIKFFISKDYEHYLIFLIIEILVIFVTTFGTLVYDEIIIIKKWGLEIDVASEISSRATLEANRISIIEDENDDNEEEEEYEEDTKENILPESIAYV